jgi:hypothetical protein
VTFHPPGTGPVSSTVQSVRLVSGRLRVRIPHGAIAARGDNPTHAPACARSDVQVVEGQPATRGRCRVARLGESCPGCLLSRQEQPVNKCVFCDRCDVESVADQGIDLLIPHACSDSRERPAQLPPCLAPAMRSRLPSRARVRAGLRGFFPALVLLGGETLRTACRPNGSRVRAPGVTRSRLSLKSRGCLTRLCRNRGRERWEIPPAGWRCAWITRVHVAALLPYRGELSGKCSARPQLSA